MSVVLLSQARKSEFGIAQSSSCMAAAKVSLATIFTTIIRQTGMDGITAGKADRQTYTHTY